MTRTILRYLLGAFLALSGSACLVVAFGASVNPAALGVPLAILLATCGGTTAGLGVMILLGLTYRVEIR